MDLFVETYTDQSTDLDLQLWRNETLVAAFESLVSGPVSSTPFYSVSSISSELDSVESVLAVTRVLVDPGVSPEHCRLAAPLLSSLATRTSSRPVQVRLRPMPAESAAVVITLSITISPRHETQPNSVSTQLTTSTPLLQPDTLVRLAAVVLAQQVLPAIIFSSIFLIYKDTYFPN